MYPIGVGRNKELVCQILGLGCASVSISCDSHSQMQLNYFKTSSSIEDDVQFILCTGFALDKVGLTYVNKFRTFQALVYICVGDSKRDK